MTMASLIPCLEKSSQAFHKPPLNTLAVCT